MVALLLFGLLAPAPVRAAIVPESDAVALTSLVGQRLHADDLTASMVGEPPYAILYWEAGSGYRAGSALAKKTAGNWEIVRATGGSLKDRAVLESLGVPADTAKALVADLKRAGQ